MWSTAESRTLTLVALLADTLIVKYMSHEPRLSTHTVHIEVGYYEPDFCEPRPLLFHCETRPFLQYGLVEYITTSYSHR